MKNEKIKLILIIIAAWALAAADLIVPIKTMYGEGFYAPLAKSSEGKIIYMTLALFTFPFIALGFSEIIKGTKYKLLSTFVFFFTSTITVSIHTAYYYYYHVARRANENPIINDILKDFDKLKNILGTFYFLGLLLMTLILFIEVLRKKSIYPRYFCLFNPISGLILLNILLAINKTLGEFVYPLLIPGTMLAIMITIYLPYYYKKEKSL